MLDKELLKSKSILFIIKNQELLKDNRVIKYLKKSLNQQNILTPEPQEFYENYQEILKKEKKVVSFSMRKKEEDYNFFYEDVYVINDDNLEVKKIRMGMNTNRKKFLLDFLEEDFRLNAGIDSLLFSDFKTNADHLESLELAYEH